MPKLALFALAGAAILWGWTAPAAASALNQIEAARVTAGAPDVTRATLTKHYLEIAPGVRFAVRGERERRQVRHARWVDGLAGDRAAVFEREGAPVFRHLELAAGRTTEVWTYPDRRVTYRFRDGRIEARHPF